MKDGHKKNRVRLIKDDMSNGMLITKEEIDQLKLQMEKKEALEAAKQVKKKAKELLQGKKQLTIPKAKRQKRVSFASIESIDFHVLTGTG
jgi:hypothetical protein